MTATRQARRYPRVTTRAPIFVELLGADRPFQTFTSTKVVGGGGCCFECSEGLGYLSLMQLSLSLGGRIVVADGRVVWERRREGGGYDVGVEFLRIAPADRRLLLEIAGGRGRREEH